mmetsp:Transcript_59150/g.139316  ORF Transcript_59150/g.139316 Transcript_59150/m.139316 type:complete len:660 (-) Transcript_59150:2296-4275(-)
MLVQCIHALAVGLDVQTLLRELLFLARLLADDHRHLHRAHPGLELLQALALHVVGRRGDAAVQRLDLGLPQRLHLVEHGHGGELVHRDDDALAQVAAAGEVVDDVARNRVQPVLALHHLHLLREALLQLLLRLAVEVLVFQDGGELVAQVVVLDQHLRHALLVEQRHRGAVFHALLEVVLGHVVAEPGVGLALLAQQRRAGEGQEVRIRQAGAHVLGQARVLGAVGLVHDDDDVVPVGQQRVVLALVEPELLDQREHHALVLAQHLAQLRAALGPNIVLGRHHAGMQEVAVDLPVQIVPVGHHHEREVAGELAEDLARVEHHREALARALGVPEHAQPAAQLAAVPELLEGVVHADELVVLRDDLLRLAVEHAEVLHVVQQPLRRQEAQYHALDAQTPGGNGRAVQLLFLIVHPQPGEKVLPLRGEAAQPGLDAIAQQAQRIGGEDLRDLGLVGGEVVVERRAQLHVAVLQLDEHQRQAVHVQQHVGSAVAMLAAHPELAHGQVVVAAGAWVGGFEVDDLQPLGHGLPRLRPGLGLVGHRHAVADQGVHLPVGGHQAHRRARLNQLRQGLVHRMGRGLRVQPLQRGAHAVGQHHLALVRAAGAVIQVIGLGCEAVQRIEAAQVLQPLQQGLLDVVFADEVLRGGHGTSLVLPVVEKKTC